LLLLFLFDGNEIFEAVKAEKVNRREERFKVIHHDSGSSLSIYNPDRISPYCWHIGSASSCLADNGSEMLCWMASTSWQEGLYQEASQVHHESARQVLSEEFAKPTVL
jgi:hypothetical protein